jgi:acyl-CoA synthetase (NDP forming)
MGGGFVLEGLRRHKFAGRIIPVNPRYQDINGLRCFTSLADIEDDIDLAVFAVPAAALVKSLSETRDGSIKIALILSSGYSEVGEDGARLERELVAAAHAKGTRIVGPNSVGIANLGNGMVTTISQAFDRVGLAVGDVALVSQSGAFGTALVARAQQEGVGFRYFISSGNEADIRFTDLSRALIARSDVRVLCGYLENIRDGEGFIELAQDALRLGKPLVVLKAGTSVVGSRAAKSHTGALVGSDEVAQSIFETYGVVRARDGEHLLELLKVFEKTPPARGRRVALVSHSGGAGVLAADAAESAGAEMPPLPEDTREKLREKLPAYATIANPLDMTGAASLQAKLMSECLTTMLQSDAYDAGLLCVALIWREGESLLSELSALADASDKPFAVSWAAPADEVAAKLRSAPVPVFSDPSRAAAALGTKLTYDTVFRGQPKTRAARSAKRISRDEITTVTAQISLLQRYGVSLPEQLLTRDVREAEEFRRRLNRPVAVKAASATLLHRTEAGAVALDITSSRELSEAYERVLKNASENHVEGVLVQAMIEGGLQAFVGVRRDPTFGPMLAVGPGGTLVELIGKVVLRPAPVTPDEALEMLRRPPLDTLLSGFRGGTQFDRQALADVIARLSQLAADTPDAAEIELNPIIVLVEGKGCAAVDFKFSLRALRSG